jgi:Kef-type K+ transport system membrane component KefB
MIAFGGLAIVAAAALAAPLVLGLFPRIRLPAIVLEIVLGIVIGLHVLGLGCDRHADPGHEPYWGSRFYFCSQVSLSSISAPSG